MSKSSDAVSYWRARARALAEVSTVLRVPLEAYRRARRRRALRARTETVATPPRIGNIELTNRCPMRCVMCPRTNNMTREQGLMEFPVFKKVIDEYAAADPEWAASQFLWLHHFGESLVHPEFGKFVRYAVSRGVKVGLSANPIMFTGETSRELLTSGLSTLLASLDGHDDESFEKVRGVPDAYERSKANLMAFLKLKTELRSPTRVVLSMIDFSRNAESIARLEGFWRGVAGIDEFLRKPFVTWNGDAADVNRFAAPATPQSAVPRTVACSAPWGAASIAWDGRVVPCCYDYDAKYVLGNVKDHTLSEIWNGEPMRALRREFLSGSVTNPLCRDCPQLYGEPSGSGI